MSYSKINATAATLSKNRTEDSITPLSGMCATCVDGCIGMCEIGKSAYRATETIYPQPFGLITAASDKDYPVDLSHFTIMGSCVGAHGVEASSESAIFPNASTEQVIGANKDLKVKFPVVIGGMGSTDVASKNWDGLAIGAAISGIILTVGENVCAMDPNSEIKDGRIHRSPEMERRVNLYKDWQDGYGEVIVQANVEDTKLKVQEYVIDNLGVETVELKWGQGAKDIGGEVKITNLKKAQLLKDRGYVVLPDPHNPQIIEAFEQHAFHEFERHSRLGMVEEEGFHARVNELRSAGAKRVTLKTGAYRPQDLARAVKFASDSKLDLLTVDAAGGGTGMSPWRMMCEWGVPGIELWSLLYQYCDKLAKKGKYVPDIAVAGGIILEDQIFKVLAMGAPYFKLACMARSPLATAMVGKTLGNNIDKRELPVYVARFGQTVEEIFMLAPELKHKLGDKYEKLPTGAIGVYSYMNRLEQGVKQLMCGQRKFNLNVLERTDIAAITREAADISGISYVMDADKDEAEKILS